MKLDVECRKMYKPISMSLDVLIIGASGMAGKAFSKYFKSQDKEVIGVSRHGPELFCDVEGDYITLHNYILNNKPKYIINCAAEVSIEYCEAFPLKAFAINSELVNELASSCAMVDSRFVHISTDHYYLGERRTLHSEEDTVEIVNTYAKSKYQGELNAKKYPGSIIIRTNITGFRYNPEKQTFIEWLMEALINKNKITLFKDFYTSTIDCGSFCELATKAALTSYSGVLNIASSESLSKKEFALNIAKRLGIDLDWANEGNVANLLPKRANNLGLDCAKAEELISTRMPSGNEVARRLVDESRMCENTLNKLKNENRIVIDRH